MAVTSTSPALIADIVSRTNAVPAHYIRPVGDRPNLHHDQSSDIAIPVIDFAGFDHARRAEIVEEVGRACRNDGFFQVKNHGVPDHLIEGIMSVTREFFSLPESERMKSYSDDPNKAVRLSTSFNLKKEEVANWRDFLRLHCYPVEDYINDWPSNPPNFRDIVSEYCKSVRALALQLLEAISESLGLDKDCIAKALGKHGQHMAMNYYPPCPQPELTYGLPGHTDPNALTVLLQDHVPGLQVLRNKTWVPVNPIPKTFVVNIGDQIQVISNGRYKSVLHRALVNNKEERISIPTFYCPASDAVIAPASDLVDKGDLPMYKSFTYKEYYLTFWDQGLRKENCLDLFRT